MSEKTAIAWEAMTDEEFLDRAETQIWLSAFASNNPTAPAHKEADRAYDEAKRREKPWLYKRAWNRAYRSAGYEPSAADIEAAKEPAQ
ncbi:hypothetical protein G6L12_08110 [Agrobacterium rhizogenes]|nr:hypothetical protein [Rhizobium rhizogenes]NTF74436.1 hypothetical protein [Rhizobium rhizogenes]